MRDLLHLVQKGPKVSEELEVCNDRELIKGFLVTATNVHRVISELDKSNASLRKDLKFLADEAFADRYK